MTRPRRSSGASDESVGVDQELGSMYDYLAKIILLGPSGAGKSCLLHRFVKNEWRVLSSQTIGVEFASKIIKVGTGARRKRIKLQVCLGYDVPVICRSLTMWQLWDTAGTERFRSVSRSYYRGAAGAILVYDITSHQSFQALQAFLNDARALASPNLSVMLVGNKLDLASGSLIDTSIPPPTPSSVGSTSTYMAGTMGSSLSLATMGPAGRDRGGSIIGSAHGQRATVAPEGRDITRADASRWASQVRIPVVTEASALNGEGVEEIFERLARTILTKIELGEIDPDDPMSGIQYGDRGAWGASDGGSIKSSVTGVTIDDPIGGVRRRRKAKNKTQNWGLRDWEEVFTLTSRRRGRGCC
ncbi:hypothetical protein CP532_2585 [Ophiocordyceps camponoti-leonardi (nom. inval.)]|nr:hypothetical protein CP532_2585 [Ophiocordyceps camponoti-leonardi (nom. inval.)]